MSQLVKFTYCCLNGITGDDCSIARMKDPFVIEKLESEEDKKELCPECGQPLKQLGRKMTGGRTKFSSMSKDDQKKSLKKRSHNHFKKEIEPIKKEQERKAIDF